MKRMVVVWWFTLYPSLQSIVTRSSMWDIDLTLCPELSSAGIVAHDNKKDGKMASHTFFFAHMRNGLSEWQLGKHEI